ncbi:MAG: class I SAM-dependent methyltransferase [Pirellulaceae bacterium]
MKASQNLSWQSNSRTNTAVWQSEAGYPPPEMLIMADDTMTGDAAYWRACAGTAMLYTGDFQNAKQLLQAVTRRADRKPAKPAGTMLETFHQHRARQIGRANITNKILIELQHGKCNLTRSPELQEVVEAALGIKAPETLVLSLRETLGMIGANEWRKKGVYVDALKANIHADYGVFSPVRGEYLDLINAAELNDPQIAWDIGTGTGVIAAVLVARGVQQVIATDTCGRALQCAAENIQRLHMQTKISLVETSLFPEGKADLIVCNTPWVPAKVNTPIERSIYDPKSQMLKGFLNGAKARLNANGEAWLIMSNLAEHIGLRSPDNLQDWIRQAGLSVIEKRDTSPQHAKSSEQSDPLYEARSREVTSLYRLRSADER